jgi:hypothetical protein
MFTNWRTFGRTGRTGTESDKTMLTALPAGALSGIVSLLVFLTLHHIWIKPIWDVLPAGLVLAVPGGLAFGWAYVEIKAGLPPRPWTALAIFALVGTTLAPAIVLGQLHPLLGLVNAVASPPVAITLLVVEVLLTATVVGGLAGWRLGHAWRAAIATALASLIFALGPGHNIPFLGGTPAAYKGMVLLVAIIAVSAITLVETQAWLVRHR